MIKLVPGTGLQKLYLSRNVNDYIGNFWQNAIVNNNLEKNALFILFDDHGRINVNWEHRFDLRSNLFIDALQPFEFDANNIKLGDNGVMIHLFLRSLAANSTWGDQPTFSDVLVATNHIKAYNQSAFRGQIKYIFVTNQPNIGGSSGGCSGYYCGINLSDGSTVQLQNYINPEPYAGAVANIQAMLCANSGNIIIILKSSGDDPPDPSSDGSYFLSPVSFLWYETDGIEYTVHGDISKYSSNSIFVIFYPNDASKRQALQEFLDTYAPASPNGHLTTQLKSIFINSVKNSNQILMGGD